MDESLARRLAKRHVRAICKRVVAARGEHEHRQPAKKRAPSPDDWFTPRARATPAAAAPRLASRPHAVLAFLDTVDGAGATAPRAEAAPAAPTPAPAGRGRSPGGDSAVADRQPPEAPLTKASAWRRAVVETQGRAAPGSGPMPSAAFASIVSEVMKSDDNLRPASRSRGAAAEDALERERRLLSEARQRLEAARAQRQAQLSVFAVGPTRARKPRPTSSAVHLPDTQTNATVATAPAPRDEPDDPDSGSALRRKRLAYYSGAAAPSVTPPRRGREVPVAAPAASPASNARPPTRTEQLDERIRELEAAAGRAQPAQPRSRPSSPDAPPESGAACPLDEGPAGAVAPAGEGQLEENLGGDDSSELPSTAAPPTSPQPVDASSSPTPSTYTEGAQPEADLAALAAAPVPLLDEQRGGYSRGSSDEQRLTMEGAVVSQSQSLPTPPPTHAAPPAEGDGVYDVEGAAFESDVSSTTSESSGAGDVTDEAVETALAPEDTTAAAVEPEEPRASAPVPAPLAVPADALGDFSLFENDTPRSASPSPQQEPEMADPDDPLEHSVDTQEFLRLEQMVALDDSVAARPSPGSAPPAPPAEPQGDAGVADADAEATSPALVREQDMEAQPAPLKADRDPAPPTPAAMMAQPKRAAKGQQHWASSARRSRTALVASATAARRPMPSASSSSRRSGERGVRPRGSPGKQRAARAVRSEPAPPVRSRSRSRSRSATRSRPATATRSTAGPLDDAADSEGAKVEVLPVGPAGSDAGAVLAAALRSSWGSLGAWNRLPEELTLKVFSFLDQRALGRCGQACRSFRAIAKDRTLWKSVTLHGTLPPSAALLEIGLREPARLALKQCDAVTAEDLTTLLRGCGAQLRSLELNACSGIDVASFQAIALLCPTRLLELAVEWCDMGPDKIEALASGTYPIETLSLQGSHTLTDRDVATLSRRFGGSLRSLDLFGCYLLTAQALDAIGASCLALRSLRVAQCMQLSSDGVVRLTRRLAHLTHLDCGGCKQLQDFAVVGIARHCPQLEDLCLSYCLLVGDNGVASLSTQCKRLRRLHLAGCLKVTDLSMRQVIIQAGRLEDLDLSFTGIGAGTIRMLANYCIRLKTLKVNHCSDIFSKDIMRVACQCPRLGALSLLGCNRVSADQIAGIRETGIRVSAERPKQGERGGAAAAALDDAGPN